MFRRWIVFIYLLAIAQANWACGNQLQFNGDFIQGGLVYGTQQPVKFKLYLNQKEVLVHEDGAFI